MAFVSGMSEFTAITDRLKTAVAGFPREFKQEIRKELISMKGSVRQSALAVLPKSGGLAALIAGSEIAASEVNRGIRLIGSSDHDIGRMDRGQVRHPLFGNRNHWYTQPVRPGWWSLPIERSKPALSAAAERALENVKQKAGG